MNLKSQLPGSRRLEENTLCLIFWKERYGALLSTSCFLYNSYIDTIKIIYFYMMYDHTSDSVCALGPRFSRDRLHVPEDESSCPEGAAVLPEERLFSERTCGSPAPAPPRAAGAVTLGAD